MMHSCRSHFALILAAGLSQRMGKDKTSLPWLNGESLLEWTVDSLCQAGWQPVVILGSHNYSEWTGHFPNAEMILNDRSTEGKTTSIAAGLAALPSKVDSILITSIDQPRPPELYRNLREEAGRHSEPIMVPDKNGRNGHPLVFEGDFKSRLSSLSESSQGLRGLLVEYKDCIFRLPCSADWLKWDINTPEAHEEALAWFQSQQK